MKRILVLSDSHRGMSFMRWCVNTVKPDAIVHLGDFYDDGDELHEGFRHIPMYQVAGNCDRYYASPAARELLIGQVCGVKLFMTHGHRQYVKSGTDQLVYEALKAGVQAALQNAVNLAFRGDAAGAKDALSPLLQDDEVKRLSDKMRDSNGGI